MNTTTVRNQSTRPVEAFEYEMLAEPVEQVEERGWALKEGLVMALLVLVAAIWWYGFYASTVWLWQVIR